jgi:hypothetical protein
MTPRKGEDTGTSKLKHSMALCGELPLEEIMEIS